jgi:Fe-S-cluster-containing hydrogenase component 2
MKIIVESSLCPQNHRCPILRVCPTDAISQNGFDAPVIDEEKCINCAKCVRYCGYGAFKNIG